MRTKNGRVRGGLIGASITVSVALIALALPAPAEAFCGFYVSQSGESLYNNATRVAMMREDQQTVMSMQNNYAGPPEDFAMVVPVPVVLKKDEVKTLEDGVFDRLDKLTAPRLVEYWQQDPCWEPRAALQNKSKFYDFDGAVVGGSAGASETRSKVTVEAQFDVGEYEVVVLSAEESNALDTWLRDNEYNIPDGAEQYFEPYVQQGTYFFVAKVNLDKVEYDDGEAVLSPLRFHYEDDDFKLPVRLGLINSKGSQDLIVYLLAKNQRYRVANYPNRKMPTNLPVSESVKKNFGGFYDTLFEEVIADEPRAVVTEYAWTATKCDPCPVDPLGAGHLQTLGADVIEGEEGEQRRRRRRPAGWTVTRLHTRYSKESLGEDLVFEKAHPIKGGRGEPEGGGGTMDHQTARRASRNNYQARYYIRHFWSGEAECEDPNWGRWGGPPNDAERQTRAAGDMGFESTGGRVDLKSTVQQETVPNVGRIKEKGSQESEGESSSGDSEQSSSKESEGSEDVDLDEAVEQEEIPGVDDEE